MRTPRTLVLNYHCNPSLMSSSMASLIWTWLWCCSFVPSVWNDLLLIVKRSSLTILLMLWVKRGESILLLRVIVKTGDLFHASDNSFLPILTVHTWYFIVTVYLGFECYGIQKLKRQYLEENFRILYFEHRTYSLRRSQIWVRPSEEGELCPSNMIIDVRLNIVNNEFISIK